MQPPNKIEVTQEFEAIVIRINGALHLWLDRKNLRAINSWIMLGRRQWFIEYVMDGATFTTDYNVREKWEEILRQLEAVLLGEKVVNHG